MHLVLALLISLFSISIANAQSPTQICFTSTGSNCIPVSATNPFPVTGGGGGSGGSGTIGAAVPSTGVYNALNVGGTLRGWGGKATGVTYSGQVAIVDASGNQITSFGSTDTFGAAFPATGTAAGFSDGTNMAAARVTSSAIIDGMTAPTSGVQHTINYNMVYDSGGGNWVRAISLAPGTAGTPSTQVLSIQGITSMTPVQVSQATASNLNATIVGTGTFATQPGPTTSGGLSVYFVQPTASDNHVNIKNGAGQVYKISVTNNSATVNYLRLYNAASGFNGCNSATNLVYQMAIPASTSVGGLSDSWDMGMAFSTGISICVTSGYATNDTTNATASAMSVNIGYK